ncbi:MAG: PBP1A family penicillin-binding protein [Chlorobiales bacterium]|nr:PBP1A family penicillin-binding protein [Chlorobiales bacterium]
MSNDSKNSKGDKGEYSSPNRDAYFNDPEHRRRIARRRRWFDRFFTATTIAIIVGIAILAGILFYVSRNLPSLEQLENPKPELATTVYSADGKLLTKFFLKNRTSVPLDSISIHARHALIATEDVEFYDHWGFNSKRFVLAMLENVFTFRSRWLGASTITMQLARNLYLTQDRTVVRKAMELMTAIQIERTYTKDEILALYLNTVYFGSGAWGIEAASWTFFNKPAIDLTIPEGALLVGLLKSPRDYDPVKNPSNSRGRRNLIIGLMAKEGFITQAQATSERNADLGIKYTPVTDAGIAPYFTEYVRRQLQEEAQRYEVDLYRDGLTVYTTIDSRMQKYAEEAIAGHMPWIQERFDKSWKWSSRLEAAVLRETDRFQQLKEKGVPEKEAIERLRQDKAWVEKILKRKTNVEVGFVAIDPATGHIKAWVGGKDFRSDSYQYQFDHVWQAKRQPGSTFKPFVYTAAIDQGIPPTQQYLNQPIVIKTAGQIWAPENADRESGGLTTLRDALRNSLNQVTIRLVNEAVPPSKIIEYAKRMGIRSPLDENYSLALGTSVLTPLELCSAYGTFANNGVHVDPIGILRIDDQFGHQLADYKPDKRTALNPATNYVMVSMLRDVINRGTGMAIRGRYQFSQDAGGKTGTTQNNKDAWFAGFTPQLVAVVWTGFDDERIAYTSMEYGQGARAALPIWANFMKRCYDDPELGLMARYFQKPGDVYAIPISKSTNMLADAGDKDAYIEYFTPKGWQQYQANPGGGQQSGSDSLGGQQTGGQYLPKPPQKKQGEGEF